jgi:hypothetical protein
MFLILLFIGVFALAFGELRFRGPAQRRYILKGWPAKALGLVALGVSFSPLFVLAGILPATLDLPLECGTFGLIAIAGLLFARREPVEVLDARTSMVFGFIGTAVGSLIGAWVYHWPNGLGGDGIGRILVTSTAWAVLVMLVLGRKPAARRLDQLVGGAFIGLWVGYIGEAAVMMVLARLGWMPY